MQISKYFALDLVYSTFFYTFAFDFNTARIETLTL